uniref:XPG N-terminal domain-containing protein n=1 Tax=Parasteatoda tepidariorum TaxID=114398 RepID=A0A2L2Y916_PARTP
MGIKGFNKFMDDEDKRIGIYEDFNIYNKNIIIDGCGLVYLLYFKRNIPYEFGGDYSQYATVVRKYFETLMKFKITPIVVFNGCYGNSADESEKHMQRHKTRLNHINNYLNKKIHSSFTPINHYEVFKDILLEKRIAHVQCDYGGDEKIAALATHYKCPVLAEDSDFYIYDLPYGIIRFSHLDDALKVEEEIKTNTMMCKIYKVAKFQNKYFIKDKRNLSLFAALVGNDYVNFTYFKYFYGIKNWSKDHRFNDVLIWLKNKTFAESNNEVLKIYKGNKRIENKIEYVIKNYEFQLAEGERLSSILEGINSNDSERIFEKSKIKTNCSTTNKKTLPKELVVAFHKGCISSTLLNIITTHESFLHAQIEAFSKPNSSSYSCSRYIRKITYSILSQHEPGSFEIHKNNCLREIIEHDWSNQRVFLKLCSKLEIGGLEKNIPKLSDIYETQTNYRDFLSAVLGMDENFLQGIQNNLQLLFGSIIYWLLKSEPKPTKDFLSALLICIIYYQIKENNLRENAADGKETEDMETLPTRVAENLNKYLQKPERTQPTNVKRIIGNYCQLQTCIWSVGALNSLLKRPFDSSKLCEYLNGTMLYNLTMKLESGSNSESLVRTFFRGEVAARLFELYMNKINTKIQANYFEGA